MAKKPTYTKEFREQAVRLSEEGSMTVAEVAKELGISTASLTKWRRQMGVGESRKVNSEALRQAREENEQLRRQLKTLEKEKRATELERDVLKKAAAFFARNLEFRLLEPVGCEDGDLPAGKPGHGDPPKGKGAVECVSLNGSPVRGFPRGGTCL